MNLFAPAPEAPQGEFCETLACGRGVRIERIVSSGCASPQDFYYDQKEDEWVAVLQGCGTVAFYSGNTLIKKFVLRAGNTLFIPAHQRHRVLATSDNPPCIWLCVFGHGMSADNPATLC